ncbi:hypothetical protein LX32DRAFT_252246 [Colletotrichum zoysiae]|uniref:Uncharacterized protein n=1 Tax=Colletotrichum zoysiae TaxID=1216348 RepID=A0AAD9H519_9PEZI|nr:hypothetical protein LX32DRAFT_252246 [Colletotrichum zoysiae]
MAARPFLCINVSIHTHLCLPLLALVRRRCPKWPSSVLRRRVGGLLQALEALSSVLQFTTVLISYVTGWAARMPSRPTHQQTHIYDIVHDCASLDTPSRSLETIISPERKDNSRTLSPINCDRHLSAFQLPSTFGDRAQPNTIRWRLTAVMNGRRGTART